MRQLLPPGDDIDAYDAARPEDPGVPLLRVNFVAALDGSVVDERGRSGGLGGSGDREMFRALRAWADAILVGAGTVRAEGYGPHRMTPELAERRRHDGREHPAPIVVVSNSLELALGDPLFTKARTPTIVLTSQAAPAHRLRQVQRVARVIVAGDDSVDLVAGLRGLRDDGYASVLCEGGVQLTGELLRAGEVDELCITVAPLLVGQARRLVETLEQRIELALRNVYAADSELIVRYEVCRQASAGRSEQPQLA